MTQQVMDSVIIDGVEHPTKTEIGLPEDPLVVVSARCSGAN